MTPTFHAHRAGEMSVVEAMLERDDLRSTLRDQGVSIVISSRHSDREAALARLYPHERQPIVVVIGDEQPVADELGMTEADYARDSERMARAEAKRQRRRAKALKDSRP